jgi:hypothetical protein
VVKVDTAENLPSGAKAHRFLLTLYGTAEQLAEKLWISGEIAENAPRAKARIVLLAFCGG